MGDEDAGKCGWPFGMRVISHAPEVVTASGQDDPVRREALPLHDEGDIAVLLALHQDPQLLRQKVDVVDLRHGGQWS